jgi:hypothetical protein
MLVGAGQSPHLLMTEIKETRSTVFTSMLTYPREVGGSPLEARMLALDTNPVSKTNTF